MPSKRARLFDRPTSKHVLNQYFFQPLKEGRSCAYNPDVNWCHFEWSYTNEIQLKIEVMTSVKEGAVSGDVGFIFGDIESIYSASIETKEHIEQIEYEINGRSRVRSPRVIANRNSGNILTRAFESLKPKDTRTSDVKLNWSRIELLLEADDIKELIDHSEYEVVIYTENCTFTFSPSSYQTRELSEYIDRHQR